MLGQRILGAVRGEAGDALAVIFAFESQFAMRGDERTALAALEMLGAFDSDDPRVLAGASWCRGVTADVAYRLAAGRTSLAVAQDHVRDIRARASHGDPLAAYVAARWYDASGRIAYRFGDYAQAREHFETAFDVARAQGLTRMIADVTSNLIRARAEERAQPLVARSQASLDLRAVEVQQYRAALEVADGQSCNEALATGDPLREHRRGVCSLHHNLANALEALGRRDEAHDHSAHASAIARQDGDGYRLAQALLAQARSKVQQRQLDEAEALLNEVLRLNWRRGHLMARQQLSAIESARGQHRAAVHTAGTLLDVLKTEGKRAPIDASLDVEVRRFTVDQLARAATAARSAGLSDGVPDADAVRRESLDVIRAIRTVLSRTLYKRQFASTVRPIYRAAWEAEADPERRLTLVEESSARELLDVRSAHALLDLPGDLAPVRIERVDLSPGQRARRAVPAHRNATSDAASALLARRAAYEDALQRTPIPTVQVDPDLVYQTKLLTASRPNLILVRYFERGSGDQGDIGATVFFNGAVYPVEMLESGPLSKVRHIIAGWTKQTAPGPALAVALHLAVIAPVEAALGIQFDASSTVVLIPTVEMREWPTHVSHPDTPEALPLAARCSLVFSLSLTLFVTRGRVGLLSVPVESGDDLLAIESEIVAEELIGLKAWAKERITRIHDQSGELWHQLEAWHEKAPEFFVFAGHGGTVAAAESFGVVLFGPGDVLTEEDVLFRLRLTRNKLCLVSACLSGTRSDAGGGDVAGFLRGFVAAGAGLVGTTLWSVESASIGAVGRMLLDAAPPEPGSTTPRIFNAADHLRQATKARIESGLSSPYEACPLVLFA